MNNTKQVSLVALYLLTAPFAIALPARADLIKQSAAGGYTRTFLMTDSASPALGKTGLTVAVKIRKAGGTYTTATNAATEVDSTNDPGRYQIALTTAEVNTLGLLDYSFTATGANPDGAHDQVVGFDPNSDLGAAALTGINTQTAKIGTNALDSPNEITAQGLVTAINTQTAKIATNAADSPNEITAQGLITSTNTQTTAVNQQAADTAATIALGYTAARAVKIDNADVATSSRMATFTYTAPPTLPGDYLNAAEIAKLAFLDAAISSRSTYAGGAVASVTGSVGSVTGSVVASSVTGSVGSISGITFPSNFGTFAVDVSGRVTLVPGQSVSASNLPTDYQQRAVAVTLPTTAPTGYGGGTGGGSDTPGTTTLLSRLGSPVGATLAADIAAVKNDTGGLTTSVAALPASTVAALFGASFITIPGSHTTTGTGEVLTYKQMQSLSDAVLGGDNTSTVPAASGTASVTYYLRGQPKVAANVVAVSTVTYDAAKNQVGRVVLIAQPYPAVN